MFGLLEIYRLCDLQLRDTQGTYHQEIRACFAEALRNLPRENFSMNTARAIKIRFRRAKEEYTSDSDNPGLSDVIDILRLQVLYGTIWINMSRVLVNETDIFKAPYTPLSIPFFYEFFGGVLKVYPAPNEDMEAKMSAVLSGAGCSDPDCAMLEDKYLSFMQYYTLTLLYQNYLRDQDGMAIAQASLQSERDKLVGVQTRQHSTGFIQKAW